MLNIAKFYVYNYSDGTAILEYDGENTANMYHISKDGINYAIDVTTLDEYGEMQEGPRYISGSLSSAIAIIEALENGEEI